MGRRAVPAYYRPARPAYAPAAGYGYPADTDPRTRGRPSLLVAGGSPAAPHPLPRAASRPSSLAALRARAAPAAT